MHGNSKTRHASETDVSTAIKGWLKNATKRSSSQQSVDSDGDDKLHEGEKQNPVTTQSESDNESHHSDDQIALLMRSCERISSLE